MPDNVSSADMLESMSAINERFGTSPTMEEMPRLSLADKGIDGPTAAHRVEEIHTPLNLAFTTYTTGTTAFQNIVGVTFPELDARERASERLLKAAGINRGDNMLVTYPPVLNLFPSNVLKNYGIRWDFLLRSNRDSLLCAVNKYKPRVIIGESSFIRSALADAQKLGVADIFRPGMTILATGAPLDMRLLDEAAKYGLNVHDLYGCQEFGWLALDGSVLRNDITLVPVGTKTNSDLYSVVAGGLDTGDYMPVSQSGHVCGRRGSLITYRSQRLDGRLELVLMETPLASAQTARNVIKGILRIKGRVVKISPDVVLSSPRTRICIKYTDQAEQTARGSLSISGPSSTELFDSLVRAQLDYQRMSKTDPTWTKCR